MMTVAATPHLCVATFRFATAPWHGNQLPKVIVGVKFPISHRLKPLTSESVLENVKSGWSAINTSKKFACAS